MTITWWPLLPVLAPAAAALLILVLDALMPRAGRGHLAFGVVALLVGAACALPGALQDRGTRSLSLCLPAPEGACLSSATPAASALQLGVLGSCAAVLLLLWRRSENTPGRLAVEAMLVLASAAGGAGVVAARDLGSWLVLLELATVPTIALVALRRGRAATHGALSLLVTSLLSFGLLVLGSALWLLATGSALFSPLATQSAAADPARGALLTLSVFAFLCGLAFKFSAVPFHAWTPVAFVGASTPIAALLATASKIAALGALLVVLEPLRVIAAAGGNAEVIALGVAGLAVGSLLLGSLVALRATDVVRLLAWSTVAQAGWVLLPLASLSEDGARASVAYVLTYAAATLVAFAVVTSHPGDAEGGRPLAAYRGRLRSHPWLAGSLAFALLTLAGLPPGIIGLVAKVMALRPLLAAGWWPLALVGVIAVVLGVAVYLRWLVVLWQTGDETSDEGRARVEPGVLAVITLGSVLLVASSVLPQLLWRLLG